jgi:uncharacterized membrane protein
MGLDIRIPIGAMFAILGLLLTVYGVLTFGDAQVYEKSLLININLWWGVAMLVFGVLMLYLGRHGGDSSVHLAQESVEGRAIEEREHRTGLERD